MDRQTEIFYDVAGQAATWHAETVRLRAQRDALLAACEKALAYIEDCVEPSCEEGDELEDGTIHDGSTPEGNALRAAIVLARGPGGTS